MVRVLAATQADSERKTVVTTERAASPSAAFRVQDGRTAGLGRRTALVVAASTSTTPTSFQARSLPALVAATSGDDEGYRPIIRPLLANRRRNRVPPDVLGAAGKARRRRRGTGTIASP